MKTFLNLIVMIFIIVQTPYTYAITVLCLGDSLTEGYGVKKGEAWPELLESNLKAKNIKVVNAGISGSTSASGPSRMKWHVKNIAKNPIEILILALGANDGLRGLSPDALKKNLSDVISQAKNSKMKIILVGMKAPPSMGVDYAKKFENVYTDLAKLKGINFMPFMLDGIAADPKLNIADGIHPNPEGHKILAKNIAKYLEKLL